MKVITIHVGETKIELQNTIWGVEKVLVNDEVVSSEYSTFGKNHSFTVNEEGMDINYSVKFSMGFGAAYDITRDGKNIVESPKGGLYRLLLLVIGTTILTLLFYEWLV